MLYFDSNQLCNSYTFSLFNKSFISSLTTQQKKITYVMLFVFGCFAAGYMIYRRLCIKAKPLSIHDLSGNIALKQEVFQSALLHPAPPSSVAIQSVATPFSYPEIAPIRNCILGYLESDEERRKASCSKTIEGIDNILTFAFNNHIQSNQTYLTFDAQITRGELTNQPLTHPLTTEQIRNIPSFRTSSGKVNIFLSHPVLPSSVVIQSVATSVSYPEIEPIRNCILGYLESDEERRKASCSWAIKVIDNILTFIFNNHIQSNQTYLTFDTQITWEELASRTLTRHLTTEQIRSIQSFRTSVEKVNAFVATLKRENGLSSLIENFDYKELPMLALVAHIKRGDASIAQFASTCLLYQAMSQLIFDRTTYSFEWDWDVHPTVCRLTPLKPPTPPRSALSKLRTLSILEHGSFIQKFFKLNDTGLRRLQHRLESPSTPISERYFHTIDLTLGPVISWSPFYQRIITIAASYFFEPVDRDQSLTSQKLFSLPSQVMVIPSFTMLQTYLNLMFEKNAISLMPLIGECTAKTITTYKLKDRRVFQVGMPQAPTPDIADGFHAGTLIFSLHDMYHGIRDSIIEKSNRQAIYHIIDRILKRDINKKTAGIRWKLTDGELYLLNQQFGHIFLDDNSVRWDDANKMRVLEDMALLAEFWHTEFGITRKHLLPREQALYDTIVSRVSQADKERAMDQLFDYYMLSTSIEDASALFKLGLIYLDTEEIKINLIKAFNCFKKAADLGHPKATYNVALMYRNGQGVEKDLTRHAEYIRKAATRSSLEALFLLGNGHFTGNTELSTLKDYSLALKYFSQVVDLDHPEAADIIGRTAYAVALMYREGLSVERNPVKYTEYMKKAAALSYIEALFELGKDHYIGNTKLLTLQDYALSFRYFSQAADLDHPEATYNVALMYRDGQGVERNLAKYAEYMRKAAALSYIKALFKLGSGHLAGNTKMAIELSTPLDNALAFKYFSQAADLGHLQSICNVAVMYREGRGVEKNLIKYKEYIQKAAVLGFQPAIDELAKIS